MAITKFLIVVLLILILVLSLSSCMEWKLLALPEHFSDQNISNYTVRYVSPQGADSEECLVSQPYNISGGCDPTAAGGQVITYCKTVGYGMVGECLGSRYIDCQPDVHQNLIVMIATGDVMATDNRTTLQAYNFVNFMLAGVPECEKELTVSCIRFSEDNYTDIYIQDSWNVAVDRLSFAFCGPLSNGIAFRNVYNNVVTNSIFRNNWNSGIANYNAHNASVINCTFRDNYSIQQYSESVELNPGQYRYAGGLNLLWNQQSIKQVNILVRNCTFINNTAGVNKNNENDTRPNLYIPRGHGGAILAAFNGTQNHNITIEDSLIMDNEAKFNGGGIFLSFYAGSNNNYIQIRNTKFLNNRCNITGGGISMYTFEVANQNFLRIENTEFYRNRALAGGGACTINLQDNQISVISNSRILVENIGIFENCSFIENHSPTGGSAVGLITNTRIDQVIRTTNFTNCKFINNDARVDSEGALMAFRYPISLLGTILFRGNKGGGLTLLQSYLDNHGSVWFENNYAMNGGGVEMRDSSFIQMIHSSSMTFMNNEAVNRGGGLSASSASSLGIDTDIIRLFNTRCFIQYDLSFGYSYPPEYWNMSIKFINNTAGMDGGAVYSTAIQSCVYTTTLNETSVIYDFSIFKLPQFSFLGNSVKNSASQNNLDFSTAPSWIRIVPDSISGAPGEILSFHISALDESGNWKEAVWNYFDNSEGNNETTSDSFLSLRAGGETHPYVVKKLGPSENCSSEPTISRDIIFSIVQILSGSVVNQTNVTINVTCCYPGYEMVGGTCELKRDNPIIRADDKNHYVYIRPQFYAEYENNNFIHAIIPIPFHHCNTQQSSLTGCLVKHDDPYQQCQENRTGFLCGKCPEGKGVDLTLRQCRDCTVGDTILVILIIIFFAGMCALILIFNVRIPNELRGCLFFIQVVGFVYIYTDGEHVFWDFHISRLFGTSLYLPLCPLPGAKALYTASYGLILPALGIIIIVVYIISARFLRHLSNKNSLDGIWFLSIIIYKFIADTSFTILRCQKVIGNNRFVFYYDGSNQCFSTSDLEHLSFAILALFLGFLVFLFPIFILLVSFKKCNISIQLTDVLNKNLKLSCRWWGSFDLLRRLLFFVVVLLFNYVAPSYTQLALFYSGLAVFFVFACAKPYNSMLANIMESVVLLDLIIITGLFLNTSKDTLHSVRGLASFLLLTPFLTIVFYYIIRIWLFCWNKWCPKTVKDYWRTCKLWIKQHIRPLSGEVSFQEESLTSDLLMTSNNIGRTDIIETVEASDFPAYSELREELLN